MLTSHIVRGLHERSSEGDEPDPHKPSYAWKSLLDAAATLAFDSDWPVAPFDPVMGIYAVTRRALDGENRDGSAPEQRLTVGAGRSRIHCGGSIRRKPGQVKGSIEPGKLADLVVLSDDIFTIAPEDIQRTKVDMTVF